jgi:hypothetical protein
VKEATTVVVLSSPGGETNVKMEEEAEPRPTPQPQQVPPVEPKIPLSNLAKGSPILASQLQSPSQPLAPPPPTISSMSTSTSNVLWSTSQQQQSSSAILTATTNNVNANNNVPPAVTVAVTGSSAINVTPSTLSSAIDNTKVGHNSF